MKSRMLKPEVLLLAFMCLFSGIASAQDQGSDRSNRQRMTVEERAKTQADRLKTELELTDKQYESVKELNLKYAKKMEENTERNQETFKTMQDDKNKEMKEILSAEQYKKYEEQNANRRRPGGNDGERSRGDNDKKDDKKVEKDDKKVDKKADKKKADKK